ncbi:hypothetical protein CDCA_CDCA02G0550 [Cyanidium caldarium]|uniref:glucose-6-phosphate 1-epimerase n=1 Tax=Cyanidium caldarium TaxID=2771 RepID=A0AAV9IR15_CYACA|nr:hypothetical protein CDCA_CDCA02G0550 [Cyanidium caldarium]
MFITGTSSALHGARALGGASARPRVAARGNGRGGSAFWWVVNRRRARCLGSPAEAGQLLCMAARDNPPPNQTRSSLDVDSMASRLAAELHAPKVDENDVPGEPSEKAGKQMEGRNGLPYVLLTNEHTKQTAEVYLFGACVTSWKVRDAASEVLFLSDQAVFDRSTAIRGGIPVCFPQFGNQGNLPNHGFARSVDWKLDAIEMVEQLGASRCVLSLRSDDLPEEHRRLFPHKFRAQYRVTLNLRGLSCELKVTNEDASQDLKFTAGLHNYFKVRDIEKVRIFGCEGLEYMDKTAGNTMRREADGLASGLAINQHTDRVYREAPEEMAIFDSTALSVMKLNKRGFPDCTVWNPYGSQGSDPGWGGFVCVEPVVFHNEGVTLKPGETWTGSQELAAE